MTTTLCHDGSCRSRAECVQLGNGYLSIGFGTKLAALRADRDRVESTFATSALIPFFFIFSLRMDPAPRVIPTALKHACNGGRQPPGGQSQSDSREYRVPARSIKKPSPTGPSRTMLPKLFLLCLSQICSLFQEPRSSRSPRTRRSHEHGRKDRHGR